MEISMGPPRLDWKKTDWDTFVITLQTLSAATSSHWTLLSQNPTPDNLDEWATILRDSIQATAEVATPPPQPNATIQEVVDPGNRVGEESNDPRKT
jgi:hypothetical protein